MARLPKWAKSVGRLAVSVYVGALVAGPAPLGFLNLLPIQNWPESRRIIAFGLAAFVLPSAVAGILAGRRLAALSASLTILLFQTNAMVQGAYEVNVLKEPSCGSAFDEVADALLPLLLFLALMAFVGWSAAVVGSRIHFSDRLQSWRGWEIGGVVVVGLLLYLFTLGPYVAARTLRPVVPRELRSSSNAHSFGIYLGAGLYSIDSYYTDPSGLVYLGKSKTTYLSPLAGTITR